MKTSEVYNMFTQKMIRAQITSTHWHKHTILSEYKSICKFEEEQQDGGRPLPGK